MRIARRTDGGAAGFHEGVLALVVNALREVEDGDLIALTSTRDDVDEGLRTWSRLTGHSIVASREAGVGAFEWVIRKGAAAAGPGEPARAIGSRLWLYTNFDCNLRCDYCCVRSSPEALRRELGLSRVQRIASEARGLEIVEGLFVTGGEPLLLPNIAQILEACAAAAPTTVLTNGMLFTGSRMALLDRIPKDRITLQISIDSPTPELHDLHRGAGSFRRAWRGVTLAREHGFRVRLAATVAADHDEAALHEFFAREGIPEEDRVVRRVALRGVAADGVALSTSDLIPEVTFTSRGVYWHPVGADDDDFFVTADHFPLRSAIDAVTARWEQEQAVFGALAQIFHCA